MENIKIAQAKYSPNVRIGNWFEEYCLEEDEIQNFLTKRTKGQLLTQKTRKLFSNFLKEIELNKSTSYIRFGAVVQLIATDMKVSQKFAQYKPALSVVVSEKTILQNQNISEQSEVTVAPSLRPCVRNSFIIKGCNANTRDGEYLRYGQEFLIESVQEGCPRLILYCSPKCANLSMVMEPTNSSMSKGEMNLPLGLCVKINSQHFPKVPTGHARWRCQHLIPSKRFETEGDPVPSNTRLVINHLATNKNLAAENVEYDTFFGSECLVSVHTYLDGSKNEKWQNVWCIKLGNEEDPIK